MQIKLGRHGQFVCGQNALVIDEPMEYTRLVLDEKMQA